MFMNWRVLVAATRESEKKNIFISSFVETRGQQQSPAATITLFAVRQEKKSGDILLSRAFWRIPKTIVYTRRYRIMWPLVSRPEGIESCIKYLHRIMHKYLHSICVYVCVVYLKSRRRKTVYILSQGMEIYFYISPIREGERGMNI